MILIKPSFELMSEIDSDKMLKSIEAAGRTCYKSEDKISEDSAKKFVAMIINRGHETVLEHEKITVRIICDRGVSHEIVRHRIASYSQESTRYCDYNNGHVAFIIPPWCDVLVGEYTRDNLDYTEGSLDSKAWAHIMLGCEASYKALRSSLNWKPEQARSVLPNSLKTEIVMTMNLREWRHFFKLRTAPAAHPQLRQITIPLLNSFKSKLPVIFDDINPQETAYN